MGVLGTLLSVFSSVGPVLFGSSSNGKGMVDSVADAIERWIPSDRTKQNRDDEFNESYSKSQDSARKMEMASHDSWIDILIDAANRSVRPFITYGIGLIIFGIIEPPALKDLHPVILQTTMIVITFWFGGRFVTKDLPAAVAAWQDRKRKNEDKKKEEMEELSDYEEEDYDS